MHPSHVPLLACAPLLLAGGCAPPEEASGSMEIVQVVRDLLADPPEWEVVRSHPDLAPMVEVLSPALRFERDGADMPSLVLAPPGRVSFRIDPEDGPARLVARAGVDISTLQHLSNERPEATFVFEVLVGEEQVFTERITLRLDAWPRGSAWVDMGGVEGIAVRPGDVVTLGTGVLGGDGEPVVPPVAIYAGFGGLRLERRRTALRTRSSPRDPNLVLVVMDTLRADRLSAYGYERATSPHLERLAARGTLFENAYAAASWTWPSTASILTGLHPQEHGVVRGGSCFLTQDVRTVAEVLQEGGFTTAAWSGNPLVSASRNFHQGFELFADHGEGFRKSGVFFDRVARWLENHAGTRFFVYLHLTEPHLPFEALPEGLRRFAPDAPESFPARMGELKGILAHGNGVAPDGTLLVDKLVPAEDRRWTDDVYDACVWSGDHWLGELVDLLERLELEDETVVAFTSDHGEELFERGFFEHSQSVHTELVRAPLVIAGPGVPVGRRVATPVSNRRLAPLLAALGGVELEPGFDALELFDSDAPARPVLYSTEKGFWNGRGDQPIYGMRLGHRAIQVAPTGGRWGETEAADGGDVRLFDLAADPLERHDLAAERPAEAARLRAELLRCLEALDSELAAKEFRVGEVTRRLLERIGYAGDG